LAPLVVEEVMSRLRTVAAAGTGVLLVEQDAGHALEIAQRAYVLEHGRISVSGPSSELAGDDRVREAYLGM
jgi:branched-chain amino acid transport system ATP-binding protein